MILRNSKITEEMVQPLEFGTGDGHRAIFCLSGEIRYSPLFLVFQEISEWPKEAKKLVKDHRVTGWLAQSESQNAQSCKSESVQRNIP